MLQVINRDALHVGNGHLSPAIAFEEEQAPIAARHRVGERRGECLRAVDNAFELVQRPRANALELGGSDRLRRDVFQRGKHGVARLRQRLVACDLGEKHHDSRVAHAPVVTLDGTREMRIDESVIKPPRGRRGHDLGERVHGDEIGTRLRHGVIQRTDELRVTDTAQNDLPFAILHRLIRVEGRKLAHGPRQGAEVLCDQAQCFIDIERARHDQHRIVRLVVQAVERLQVLDVDAFDVGAGADRFLAIVVPLERCREHALHENAARVVLAAFHLVAHHRHLAVEILAGNERID
ncbi:MAG TPA: hypothetical protein VKG44_09365, partial [Candidatus Baltobacteraceae bacterium]|nr:hypothetical protein [Candidatus Baltobacteraceae bacterium]